MKLYTEEQIRKAIRITRYFTSVDSENDIVDSMKPIELPSKEEIHKQGFLYTYANELPDENAVSHIQGAEWVIDKIKNQQ